MKCRKFWGMLVGSVSFFTCLLFLTCFLLYLFLLENRTACVAPSPAVFICLICGNCFSSPSYLDKHILDTHTEKPQGRLECPYCPYTTDVRSSMTDHERMHSGDRPFSCPSCDKKFTYKHNLVDHQRVHTGEKPYGCNICGQQFRDSSGLWSHRKLHLDDGKPHACRYCGRAFRLKSNLTKHLMTHTGERRHACRVCGQKFTKGYAARRHEQQVHSGQVPVVDSDALRDDDEDVAPK